MKNAATATESLHLMTSNISNNDAIYNNSNRQSDGVTASMLD